jgi:NAD(P)-dependent dehydrogenase (short-subunit alcohol dehydrogenase family)
MKTIRGKTALVTGAASGLGKAIALRLAEEGANLVLWDLDLPGAQAVASYARRLGVEASARRCDVADRREIDREIAILLAQTGGVDILVNNAGVGFYGPTTSMTEEQWDWLLAINLHAPIHITRQLLPSLLDRPEAHIVNMASICGLVAGGRFAAYHVSKFALVGFSEALRAEYGRQGLGVTAICPGPVRTRLYASSPSGHKKKPTPEPPRYICTTAVRVANKTIRAIRGNRGLAPVGGLAYALYFTKRLAPGLLDVIQQFGRRKRMKKKAQQIAGRSIHAPGGESVERPKAA